MLVLQTKFPSPENNCPLKSIGGKKKSIKTSGEILCYKLGFAANQDNSIISP
jgi:hypothetical protein